MRLSSSSSFFFCRVSLSRRPSSLGGTRRVTHQHHHVTVCHPPFPNAHNRFEFSAPRYYDFVSHSKHTKTRAKKDAKTAEMYFESEKPRGTTTTSRAKSIIIERRGSFTQILKERETLGAHFLSFFLSLARARPAQRREVFQMFFLVFSLSFSLFFSLSLLLVVACARVFFRY